MSVYDCRERSLRNKLHRRETEQRLQRTTPLFTWTPFDEDLTKSSIGQEAEGLHLMVFNTLTLLTLVKRIA